MKKTINIKFAIAGCFYHDYYSILIFHFNGENSQKVVYWFLKK
jgi:hypothetical protein